MLGCLQDKTCYCILDFRGKSAYYNLCILLLKDAGVCWLDLELNNERCGLIW